MAAVETAVPVKGDIPIKTEMKAPATPFTVGSGGPARGGRGGGRGNARGGAGGASRGGAGGGGSGASRGRGGGDFRRGGAPGRRGAMGGAGNRDDRPRSDHNNARNVDCSASDISMATNNSTRSRNYFDGDFHKRMQKIEGPTLNLGSIDASEKEFNNRCRLYVGNLCPGSTDDEVKELFTPYGKVGECFVNTDKNFGFVRLDLRVNAEKARAELDGRPHRGRPLRVRFSYANSAIRVKNLNQFVTNELLEWGFQVFGGIERAVVICDERGKSTGEGIVEFSKKPSALFALKKCTDGAYFLTRSLRPCVVEPYEPTDESEGFPDNNLYKNSNEFHEERSVGPWFAEVGSFEEQYADRWKEHFLLYKQKFDALKFEQKTEHDKLIAHMDFARYENETEKLRQQLLERESLREKQKMEYEMMEKRAEEQKRMHEEQILRQQEADRARRQDNARREEQLSAVFSRNPFMPGQEPFFARREFQGNNGNSNGASGEPTPLMDAFDGRDARPERDNRGTRWSAAPQGGQGGRRGMPMGNDGPHMKRGRY